MEGVTRSKQKFQGLFIFTPDQLYFLKLILCKSSTVENLAAIITNVANQTELDVGKFISVCTEMLPIIYIKRKYSKNIRSIFY